MKLIVRRKNYLFSLTHSHFHKDFEQMVEHSNRTPNDNQSKFSTYAALFEISQLPQ